jgi:adenine-specific DNA-methyltransferase
MSIINLNEPFQRETCVSFFQDELLPDDFSPVEEEIDLLFKPQTIKQVTFLGDSRSLGLKVYHITHDSPHYPRVSLTKETFRLMKEYNDFHVLAFYTSPGSVNYRLSYVTIGITADDKKVKYEYSNPRRYSYFLGPDAKVHTPARFLIKKRRIVDINDLQERFSVEVVNKEFYKRIATLFTSLVGGKRKDGSKTSDYKAILKLPSITEHQKMQEFAVRMIGRIVFCWFLKKKSASNGDSLIPEDVLSLKSVKENKNYYHTVLEKLFFQVLNTPIKDRRDEFKTGPFAQIPFLNGGLFEDHPDDFYAPVELFGTSNNINTLIVDDNWLGELLELLEEYNFTIDENTSMDVELSVDPEMLGRIFENLLAEINPETGETARKSTGSYYTPRPIVEYMVDESLKQYLLTKTGIKEEKLEELLSYSEDVKDLTDDDKEKIVDALDEVKIIDPACGSGAFPMGILQKMVFILQQADPESINWLIKQLDRIPDAYVRNIVEEQLMKENWNYIRKLGLIRNSIYGVDIQQIAVEISKLRVFLSLIVDSKIDDAGENRGIKALPNLEFKFVCANTLIGLPKVSEKAGSIFEAHTEIKKLKSLRERYFNIFGHRKHQIERQFREIQDKMFKHSLEMVSMGEKTLALSGWDPFSDKAAEWFDPDWMFGIKEGFDIVISNPPYVQIQNFSGRQIQKDWENQGYQTFVRTGDIYCLFYEKGNLLLRNQGVLTYITSNKWMRANYGKNFRKYLVEETNPLQIIDFGGYKVFDSAAVDTNILIFAKAANNFKTRGLLVLKNFNGKNNLKNYFNNNSIILKYLSEKNWIIASKDDIAIKYKIEKKGIKLRDWDIIIYRGVLTGFNNAFIVDGAKKDELIAKDPNNLDIIKPILRGRDISKYFAIFADLWLIFTRRGIDIDKYPEIKEYLYQFYKQLRPKNRGEKTGRKPGPYKWYEIQDSISYYQEFEKDKIIYMDIAQNLTFTFDSKGMFMVNTCYFLNAGKSNKYLLSILNSKMMDWYYRWISAQLGEKGIRHFNIYIEQLPIPKISEAEQQLFVELVDKIILAKENNQNADTSDMETEIDRMVYQLYELTPEEIAIVEGEWG